MSDGEDRVVFFPFADGQWDYELEGTNDFEIMSHWTCEGINDDDRPCGPLDGSTGLPNAYVFPGEENDEDGPDCDL